MYSFVPLIYDSTTKPDFGRGNTFRHEGLGDYRALAIVRRANETRIYSAKEGSGGGIHISSWSTLCEYSTKLLLELQAGGSGGMSSMGVIGEFDGRGGGGGDFGLFMIDVENRDYIIKIGKGGKGGLGN